jgi:hypothetical protein
LDLANQLFHDVSLHCSALKREVNAAKDVLVRFGFGICMHGACLI